MGLASLVPNKEVRPHLLFGARSTTVNLCPCHPGVGCGTVPHQVFANHRRRSTAVMSLPLSRGCRLCAQHHVLMPPQFSVFSLGLLGEKQQQILHCTQTFLASEVTEIVTLCVILLLQMWPPWPVAVSSWSAPVRCCWTRCCNFWGT